MKRAVLKRFTPHWRDFGCTFAFYLIFPGLARLTRTGSEHQQSSGFCSEDQHWIVTKSQIPWAEESHRCPLATVAVTGKLDMEV